MSSEKTDVPFVPVNDPGTTETEWRTTTAQPEVKLFTKHWVPTLVSQGKPPVAALLFIHGFNENIYRYDHVLPVLSDKGIYVTAYDQRGYGVTAEKGMPGVWKKENHSNTTIELLFQDLNQVILAQRKRFDDKYGKGAVPFFIMGHSMGGQLALSSVTRDADDPYLPPTTTEGIAGVIGSAPWLKLTKPPPSLLHPVAKGLLKTFPNMPWVNPVDPELCTRDPTVLEDMHKNPYLEKKVFLRAIIGPLLNGYDLLGKRYQNFPPHLPLLLAHGDKDPVVSYKGSVEFLDKVKTDDKKLFTFPDDLHEPLQEGLEKRGKAANVLADWVLEHAKPHESAATTNGSSSSLTAPLSSGRSTTNTSEPPCAEAPHAAWATLLTADNYLPGLLVFAYSLLQPHDGQEGSHYPLVVMVTPDVSDGTRAVIRQLGCVVHQVDPLIPRLTGTSLAEERFSQVWTKLRAFELEEYDRIGLVDSDMLVRRNMDNLMDISLPGEDEDLPADQVGIAASSACTCNPRRVATYPPDWVPDNCAFTPQRHPSAAVKGAELDASSPETYHLVNSGLVILRPSVSKMIAMAHLIQTDPEVPTYRFPDQDFLAKVFRGQVVFLPYVYNALKPLRQCHPEMWNDEAVRNVHYILSKPWAVGNYDHRDSSQEHRAHVDQVTHGWWWAVYPAAVAHARRDVEGNILRDDEIWWLSIGQYVRDVPPK